MWRLHAVLLDSLSAGRSYSSACCCSSLWMLYHAEHYTTPPLQDCINFAAVRPLQRFMMSFPRDSVVKALRFQALHLAIHSFIWTDIVTTHNIS